MNKLLPALFAITASALATPSPTVAAPVPINDYLGDWAATAAPYASGNVVNHAGDTWLSIINGNTAKPGAPGTASRWRLVGHARPFYYQAGDTGPGGGVIFFVDRDDQFPDFDYLEAAPDDLGGHAWCDRVDVSIPKAKARAVGRGPANTQAMLAACAWGAAQAVAGYRGPYGKDDWFLPSLGELRLMYRFAEQSGKIGQISSTPFWSSTESGADTAWYEAFYSGYPTNYTKAFTLRVRPIRAF